MASAKRRVVPNRKAPNNRPRNNLAQNRVLKSAVASKQVVVSRNVIPREAKLGFTENGCRVFSHEGVKFVETMPQSGFYAVVSRPGKKRGIGKWVAGPRRKRGLS